MHGAVEKKQKNRCHKLARFRLEVYHKEKEGLEWVDIGMPTTVKLYTLHVKNYVSDLTKKTTWCIFY